MKPFWPVDMVFQIIQRWMENPASYPNRGGHPGTDFTLPVGNKLYAVWGGKCTFAGYRPSSGYGREVDILVNDRWLVIYGHLSTYNVSTGDMVEWGQVIGLSGGDPNDDDPIDGMSGGAHLHLEIRDQTKPQTYPLIGAVDPEIWLATDLDTQTDVSTDIVTVITDYINIRLDPSTNRAGVGRVLYGMDLETCGEPVNGFYPVKLWVSSGNGQYLE